jgi:hypothetical protein
MRMRLAPWIVLASAAWGCHGGEGTGDADAPEGGEVDVVEDVDAVDAPDEGGAEALDEGATEAPDETADVVDEAPGVCGDGLVGGAE